MYLDEPTTADMFIRTGYGITDFGQRYTDDTIYNSTWPVGNQVTVGYHNMLLASAKRTLESGESFRIDVHYGDTAHFMTWCNEMHINCDNQCSNYELYNKLAYEAFSKYKPIHQSWFNKWLYGKQLEFNGRKLPQKYPWMWWNGKELEQHESYLGLTDEQIAEVEAYING